MLRREIIEKAIETEAEINVCKTFANGLEIIRAVFDRDEDIISSVEKDKFGDITYTDIRLKIGNAVCYEFTVEDEKTFNELYVSDINSLLGIDVKGHWNIFGVEEDGIGFTDLYDLYDELF